MVQNLSHIATISAHHESYGHVEIGGLYLNTTAFSIYKNKDKGG
jgi:hypothetical protein